MHDLARTFGTSLPLSRREQAALLLRGAGTVKGLSLIGIRISHGLYRAGHLRLAALVKQVTQVVTGADIAIEAEIGPGLRLLHPVGLVVAGGSRIGANCTLHQATLGGTDEGAPQLGDAVRVAPGARILGRVDVDDGCHVAANAVLTRTIPGRNFVLAGVPARQLRPVDPA